VRYAAIVRDFVVLDGLRPTPTAIAANAQAADHLRSALGTPTVDPAACASCAETPPANRQRPGG